MEPTCNDDDACDRPAIKRGKCNAHYLRWYRSTPKAERSPVIRATPEERFFSFVNKMGPIAHNRPDLGRCWIWRGGKDPGGYGIFWADGTSHRAHVWSFKTFAAPVPDGLELDHFACDREDCVNWQHVQPETHWINVLRSGNRAALNALKEKCPAGHNFDEANTRINKQGARECKICKRKQQRELKQAQRAIERGYVPLPEGAAMCLDGHELTEETARVFKDGATVCLICTAPKGTGRWPREAAALPTPPGDY